MIATILTSSANFHAVEYNQQKVEEGKAELLEMKNFDWLADSGKFSTSDLQEFLMRYSRRNSHIRNAQFHVVISCQGREYSFDELVEIAHRYLKEMGYESNGQPLLIYGHRDTDNNHIHIITSRVAPDGHKIDHNHEKRRSLSAINRVMGQEEGLNVSEDVAQALTYQFENVAQFKAILESEGYECYEEGDALKVKRGGNIIGEVKLAVIEQKKSEAANDDQRRKRIRAYLLKYRDLSANKEELAAQMHRNFGISLVFFGKADSPYGYTIVDHHGKCVLKGSAVLAIRQLLEFRSAEERFRDIDKLVAAMLQENGHLTTRELNAKLKRQFGTRLTKDGIVWGEKVNELPKEVMQILAANDKQAWLQSFGPTSEVECAILYKFSKMEISKGLKAQKPNAGRLSKAVRRAKGIMADNPESAVKERLFEAGMRIYRQNGQYYCVDVQDQCIFNMNDQGLDIELLNRLYSRVTVSRTPQAAPKRKAVGNGLKRTLTQQGGARDENREYEVGSDEGYEESIQNESRLSR